MENMEVTTLTIAFTTIVGVCIGLFQYTSHNLQKNNEALRKAQDDMVQSKLESMQAISDLRLENQKIKDELGDLLAKSKRIVLAYQKLLAELEALYARHLQAVKFLREARDKGKL